MKQVNVALVAFGRIAKTHALAAYMANLKFDLPFELRVSHIITKRPLEVPFSNVIVCASLEEALQTKERIDVVDICNINEAHYEDILMAIKAKKAIYCEKPLTDSVLKSKQATTLVQESGLIHGVPLIFRYLPCIHMLKDKLTKQELGPIIHVKSTYFHNSYLNVEKRKTWRTKQASGGGASIDLGIHMVDVVCFLLGAPKVATATFTSHFKDVQVDEVFQTKLEYQEGMEVEIHAARIYSQEHQKIEIEVFCEKGSYLCSFEDPYVLVEHHFGGSTHYLKPSGQEPFMRFIAKEAVATDFHLDAHMACISDFARKVSKNPCGQYFADFSDATFAQSLLGCEKNKK